MDTKAARSPQASVGWFLFMMVAGGFLWAVVSGGSGLEVNCSVRLLNQNCTFTNTNTLMPNSRCIKVKVVRMQGERGDPKWSIKGIMGSTATSGTLCSGWLLGQTTKTVDIPQFDRNIAEMCGDLKNCGMEVEQPNEGPIAVGPQGCSKPSGSEHGPAQTGVTRADEIVPPDQRDPRCSYSGDGVKIFCR